MKTMKKKKKSEITLLDLFIYCIFLIATTVLAMSITEIDMFYFVRNINRLFLTRPSYNENGVTVAFKDLVTIDDWWIFAKTTFPESIAKLDLKNDSTFGGYICVTSPRLRQLRVRNETCNINFAFRNLFDTCYGGYSSENEDLEGFQNHTYMTPNEVGATSLWGRVATYGGGGYIEGLSLDIEENKQTLTNLENSSWIDRATRAIVIEFAVFNANINMFCNIQLLTEIPSTGGIVSFSAISPLKYSILCNGPAERISAQLFYGLIIYYTFNLIYMVIKTGCTSILDSIWNLLDLIIILLGYVTLAYIIWHNSYLASILNNETIRTHQFSLDIICHWYMAFTSAIGLCVFLVWIKLLKYVNLHLVMLQFNKTLQRSAQDLLGFAIMFSIVFVAYSNLSLLLFGSSQGNFRDFPNALLSTIRMVLCDFDYTDIKEEYPILAPFFFLSFILLVIFILMNMFLAILYQTYGEVKSKLKSGRGSALKRELMNLFEKLRKVFPCCCRSTKKVSVQNLKSLTKPDRNGKMLKKEDVEMLNKWFEILADQRSQEETDELYERTKFLEESLDNLVINLEDILKKINQASAK